MGNSGLGRKIGCLGVSFSAIFSPTIGLAQTQSSASTLNQQPVVLSGQSRAEIENQAPPQEVPKPQVAVESDRAFSQDDCSLAQSEIRVSLTQLSFEAPDGGAVDPVLAPLLTNLAADEGGDQPISVVCRIRDRVNGALARAGYVARVQVPAQELKNGNLRLVIVVGRIIEMRVRGNVGRFNTILDERLRQITALKPFNKDEAIRRLLLANDIPGLKINLALRNAGGAPGDLIGDVTVEAQTAQVLFNVQNAGSRQLGREVATLRGELYGLTGLADRTYVALSNSLQWKETHIAQIGHDMAIGSSGLRTGIRLSFARSEPDIPNLDLQSESFIGGLDISMPLMKSVNHSLLATGGFEILNQATRIKAGATKVPFTHDRIRVLFARINGSLSARGDDGRPVFQLDAYTELRKGIGVFGASQTGKIVGGFAPSRFEGDPQAFVLRGEAEAHLMPLPGLSLNASVFGQWANHPLLNLEEFSIGSFTYGRGYDPGANGGDRAFAVRIEPRLQLARIGKVQFEAGGFFDYVRMWNLDLSAGTEANRTFRSVGGGLRIILQDRAVLELTYAKPLDKVLVSDQRKPTDRLLISLTTKLWPWGSK